MQLLLSLLNEKIVACVADTLISRQEIHLGKPVQNRVWWSDISQRFNMFSSSVEMFVDVEEAGRYQ